jgi:hypothetical protein
MIAKANLRQYAEAGDRQRVGCRRSPHRVRAAIAKTAVSYPYDHYSPRPSVAGIGHCNFFVDLRAECVDDLAVGPACGVDALDRQQP